MPKIKQEDGYKVVCTALPVRVADKLKALAVEEKRSMTKQLELILTEWVEEELP